MCCQVVLCVFSQSQIGRGHVYIEYPRSAKSTVLLLSTSTPKEKTFTYVLLVKMRIVSPRAVFFCVYKQMVIASGSDDNVPWRHSPGHFPEGNLVP